MGFVRTDPIPAGQCRQPRGFDMLKRRVYCAIAQTLMALRNCEKSHDEKPENERKHWADMCDMHEDRIEAIVKANLPHGSGFDSGTKFDFEQSTPDRLIFGADFHHMNDGGYYDGWSIHQVIVTPSLAFGFNIRITGRDRRQIKDYIAETFNHCLMVEID